MFSNDTIKPSENIAWCWVIHKVEPNVENEKLWVFQVENSFRSMLRKELVLKIICSEKNLFWNNKIKPFEKYCLVLGYK